MSKQRCTWKTQKGKRCKRLCRWPSDVCGIHIRERETRKRRDVAKPLEGAQWQDALVAAK